MRLKISSKRALSAVILAGLALPVGFIFYSISKGPVRNGAEVLTGNTIAPYEQERARPGLPIRLKIPSINVDAPIEHVGLAPDGAMDAPKERANAAWFELGQRPGENGSAVIAGHYGWANKQASAFDNLYELRPGDRLYIEDDRGTIISFVVRESRRYDPDADAGDVFGSGDGEAHLNLITCEGAWDKVSRTYSQRLVVFTDRE